MQKGHHIEPLPRGLGRQDIQDGAVGVHYDGDQTKTKQRLGRSASATGRSSISYASGVVVRGGVPRCVGGKLTGA
jgi:hypothetical protein